MSGADQPSIKAIDKVSVARICSGQVITDLATAVKELVENSLRRTAVIDKYVRDVGVVALMIRQLRKISIIGNEKISTIKLDYLGAGLIRNTKDAGAKHVEVKLKEFGVDLIEVSDNGSGVSPSNYEGLALKYHTSKLSTFSDLTVVKSFGFRGEALSSLCELAGSFSVTTRTVDESVGVKLTYGRDGKLIGKETAPRQVGTTVSISNMFEPLPVRRGEFRRNIKRQFNKLLRGMQAYALISLGVRITVTNTKTKGGRQTHIGTQYNKKMDDNVTNVFGAKFLRTLSPVSILLPEEGIEDDHGEEEEEAQPGDATPSGGREVKGGERKIWGMVSKAGEGVGRADNDRQFLYLNGRPVDLPKFTRAVGEVWRAYEMKQKPAFILDLRLPPGTFDVNVTPDKREIFMTGEAKVLDSLKTELHKLWESSRYTIPVNQGQLVQARLTESAFTLRDTPAKSPPATASTAGASRVGVVSPETLRDTVGGEAGAGEHEKDLLASGGSVTTPPSQEPLDGRSMITPAKSRSSAVVSQKAEGKRGARSTTAVERNKQSSRDDVATVSLLDLEKGVPGDEQSSTRRRMRSNHAGRDSPGSRSTTDRNDTDKEAYSSSEREDISINAEGRDRERGKSSEGRSQGGKGNDTGIVNPRVGDLTKMSSSDNSKALVGGARTGSDIRSRGGADRPALLAYDMKHILGGCRRASRFKRKRDARNASAESFSAKLSGCGAKDPDSKAAARAFSRVLHKEHFTQMRVVGQFNLGFMICLLGSDLFILDQHACDEKYNFEVLQETTTIHQQPLVRPLPLETSASEEITIMDNIPLFERNGFRFMVDENQPTTKKLKITAIPFSKGTQFGVGDVHELASIVAENNTPGEIVRLPKARAMFASRACRSSIMIGKALDKGQMARVVAKMATIEQPWNCPHGRPTMRHLADISRTLRSAAGLEPLLEA